MYRMLVFLLLISSASFGQHHYPIRYIETKTDASFRGLSVAGELAIWVSGSHGWVGRSADGGVNWTFRKVPGYDQCDFRTIYAFDSSTAIIANTGSPAYILRTTNGGATWQKVYENRDTSVFIDGIDFWSSINTNRGIIYGDPINGRLFVLYTQNAGKTWTERHNPPALQAGEASFAASGTNINCYQGNKVIIATGGAAANLYLSGNKGKRWKKITTPMLCGTPGSGIFSCMLSQWRGHWYIAGGNYQRDSISHHNFFYTNNSGRNWLAPQRTTRGYRECLAQIPSERPAKKSHTFTLFASGPSGIDISVDDGKNWLPLSDEKGFHVMKPSTDGNRIFLAGSNGKLAVMSTTE